MNKTLSDERTVLRLLVERLESEVRGMSRLSFSAWGGGTQEMRLQDTLMMGKLHFAEAVLLAKAALESEDADRIALAALVCPGFERTGRELQAKKRRRNGGKARGEQQAKEKAERWQPHVDRYNRLLAEGMPHRQARKEALEGCKFDPSDKDQRKMLPDPTKTAGS